MTEQTRTADGWTGYSQTDLAWFAEHYADTDWMVHVVGPDDCLAEDDNGQPFNELEAHMAAKGINEMYASLVARDPSPYNPFLHATVFHCGVPVADAESEPAPVVQVSGQQEIPAEPDPDADAPSCRDCGTWPCARHATDADRAEHERATGSDEAETGGEPCRPCGGQGFWYTPGGEETVDCLLCGGTGVAGGAER